jgi:hypothetical protein
LKIHFNIFLPSTPRSTMWPVSLKFPHQLSYRRKVLHTLENQRCELGVGRTDMTSAFCMFWVQNTNINVLTIFLVSVVIQNQ